MYAAVQQYVDTSSNADVFEYVTGEISPDLCDNFYNFELSTDWSTLMAPPCNVLQAIWDGRYWMDTCHPFSAQGRAMCDLLHPGALICGRSVSWK